MRKCRKGVHSEEAQPEKGWKKGVLSEEAQPGEREEGAGRQSHAPEHGHRAGGRDCAEAQRGRTNARTRGGDASSDEKSAAARQGVVVVKSKKRERSDLAELFEARAKTAR